MNDTNRHGATPLGGRAKRSILARQWAGYVALERICPACSYHNVERNRFCARCAADISLVEPTAAENEVAGKELLRYRLASEQRAAARARVQHAQGGSGLIIVGSILILIGAWLSTDVRWQLAVWGSGIVFALAGIWRVRTDAVALRSWGVILGGAVILLLGLFVTNSMANDASLVLPTPTPQPTVALAATPLAGSITDVPTFRGDASRTGQQPGPAPASQPRIAWRYDTGGDGESAPVVAGGRLFVTSKRGDLVAIDASDGTRLWSFTLSDYVVRSTPLVVGDTVYVGAGFDLFAVDVATGQERRRQATGYLGQSAPLVVGTTVYVASQEGWIYAFAADTGESRWRISTEGFPFASVTSNGTDLFVATDAGIVNAIALNTGRQRWRRLIDDAFFTAPVIADGTIVIAGRNAGTYAIDAETGKIRWSIAASGMHSVAIADGTVYQVANNGSLTAMSLDDGTTAWTVASGRADAADPVIAGSVVIIGSGQNVVAVDRANGTIMWTVLTGDTVSASPVVTGGSVFVTSADGFITRLTAG